MLLAGSAAQLPPGGLFEGRAGAVLRSGRPEPARPTRPAAHVDALSWEAVAPEPGQVHFIGTHGYRLSTDLATGSAGVLLALDAAAEGTGAMLPFVGRPTTPGGGGAM